MSLKLCSSAETFAVWPFAFEAVLDVTLRRDKLKLELSVLNAEQQQPLSFAAALHTYIEVTDATSERVCVRGLSGCTYLDKVPDPKAPQTKTETEDCVRFTGDLLDRVYLSTPAETLLEVGTGAAVSVEHTSGWRDTVVWNPGAKLMPDCWQRFACVESAVVAPQTLAAGYVWSSEINLSVVDL